jgi:hypothetical protein
VARILISQNPTVTAGTLLIADFLSKFCIIGLHEWLGRQGV